MKRLALWIALSLVAVSSTAQAGGKLSHIKVMTQNQYLGADLTPIVGATSPEEFNAAVIAALQQIAANRTVERVGKLASLISNRRPHIAGLQEMYEFTCTDFGSGVCQLFDGAFNDHLTLTMQALQAQGANYTVAAQVENLVLPPPGFPFPGLPVYLDADETPDMFVGVIDRDVILARNDVAASVTSFPCQRPSLDGCNFDTVAQAMTLIGPINIERGFVGVDATVNGRSYRIVNTHLEVQNPSADPLAPGVQAAQASQLIGTMSMQPPAAGSQLIIVGDINSSPDDTRFPNPTDGPFFTPYQQLVNGTDLYGNSISAPYADIWNLNRGMRRGYTCCQEADLLNPASSHSERIDVIFSLDQPKFSQSSVLGIFPWQKTPSGLWPSDHATVIGRLFY